MSHDIITKEISAFNSRCDLSKRRLMQENTVSGAVRCSRVNASHVIKPLVRKELSSLQNAASHRIEEIIGTTKEKIASCTNVHVKVKMLCLARNDWSTLRGNFPLLAQQSERYLQEQFNLVKSTDGSELNQVIQPGL